MVEGWFLIFSQVSLPLVSGVSGDLPVGGPLLGRYYRILEASMAFAKKMRMEGSLTGD
jgi:hypothetical protein